MSQQRFRSRAGLAGALLGSLALISSCASPILGPFVGGSTGEVTGATASACTVPSGDQFTSRSPAPEQLDPAALRVAVAYATANQAVSVRIYRHDCLVAESGNDPSAELEPSNLWSATKGIVGLLVGRAVTLGDLGLDDPIGRYLPQADAAHGAITVRQLLTQTSGLDFAWANDIAAGVIGTRDSVAWTLHLPFVHPRGTYFQYAQTTITLLGAVVEAAVGLDLQEFARRELFDPLGIPTSRWSWSRDGAGHTYGFAFLAMAPIDLGRIGTLLLHRGDWRGQQLISADYVEQMSAPTSTNGGYGLLVWTNRGDSYVTTAALTRKIKDHPWLEAAPRDTYALSGLFDQMTYVIPSLDMVVIRTGWLAGDQWKHEFFRLLMAAVSDVHIADPGPYRDGGSADLTDLSALLHLSSWPK